MTAALERAPLAFTLALALPAYWQTRASFQDIEHRLRAEGSRAVLAFELESRESLFLEIELVVQSAEDGPASTGFAVNGHEIADLPADRLYVLRRAKLLVSADVVRTGRNEILVESRGAAPATFELTARLQNYYGINPKFPRAFVVSDEAAALFFSEFSLVGRALRFGWFCLASFFILTVATRFFQRSLLSMALPSGLLWGALVYGFLTPLHVFLSVEGLLAASSAPLAVLGAIKWAWPRRLLLAQAAGVTLVTLTLLEVAFRLYNRVSPSFIFYSDSYGRYRGRPGAPHFDSWLNSRGFLDVEPSIEKKPGVFRIVAIGDSFALGVVPYPSNFLTLLEDSLTDRNVEVINMGIAATGPDDYLSLLVNEGLSFEPDLVMAGFFIGNDFEARARRLHERSYVLTFFRFLWTLTSSAGKFEHPGIAADAYDDDRPTFDRNQFLAIVAERARLYRKDGSAEKALPGAFGALREMDDVAGRTGADFVVVLIPDEVQVDEALQEEVARAYRSTPDAFDFALPNRLLAARLSDEAIAFLDLLPVFLGESGGARLYKPQDTHWNLAGNRLAADAIAPFLARRF